MWGHQVSHIKYHVVSGVKYQVTSIREHIRIHKLDNPGTTKILGLQEAGNYQNESGNFF